MHLIFLKESKEQLMPISQDITNSTKLTEVINMFASLVVDVYHSMNESEDKLMKAKKFLSELNVLKLRSSKSELLLHDILDKIKAAQSAVELVLLLTPYWSFYNHQLLTKLIRQICYQDTKFTTFVNLLETLRVCELPPLIQPVASENAYHSELLVVEIQCDFTKTFIEELFQIQNCLCMPFEIEIHSLLLKRIQKGTNKLEFLVPKVVDVKLEMLSRYVSSLRDEKIKNISFNGQNYKIIGMLQLI